MRGDVQAIERGVEVVVHTVDISFCRDLISDQEPCSGTRYQVVSTEREPQLPNRQNTEHTCVETL